jgi:hypothetical protein
LENRQAESLTYGELNKNHGQLAVVFYLSENNLRCRFAERLDALGAQGLLDHAALFQHGNLLQIRLELAVGCAQGERAAVSEGGCLAAGVAFSHFDESFPYDDTDGSVALFKGRAFYHTKYPSSSKIDGHRNHGA